MIQVFKPFMGEEEIDAVAEVLKSGWIGLGPKTAEFEKRFALNI
jgi:perosamine synthetase